MKSSTIKSLPFTERHPTEQHKDDVPAVFALDFTVDGSLEFGIGPDHRWIISYECN